ncbi:MAG: glycerophosphoryl diester phosphodiesterase [Hydrogenophaga sp.]|jgi:glycerophosphoryl diester phosphodiesterase
MTVGTPDSLPGHPEAGPAPSGGSKPHAVGSMEAQTFWPYPRWIAHRGAGKLAPENTLAAFRLGAAHGYRMFECDAKLSADGVVMLLHDDTLERTSNGQGMAGDLPWRELSQLDAGAWHSRAYTGEPLPTLAAVSRWCIANGLMLNIEIKPTPGLETATGEAVAREAQHLWRDAPVPPLLTSFRPESLAGARSTAPELPRGLLLDSLWPGWLAVAQQLGCVAIVCNHALWDAALVAQVRTAGMRQLSYTVNMKAAAQRLIDLGTDGIITDAVDRFAPTA